jgi:hypothetical protein
MNNIEEDLKRALRRQNPPSDFVGKIMGRVASGETLEPEADPGANKVLAFRPKPRAMVWLAAAAAAALLMGLFITRSYMPDRGQHLGSGSGSPPVTAENSQPQVAPPLPMAPKTASGPKEGGNKGETDLVASGGAQQHSPHSVAGSYHRRAPAHPSEEVRHAEEQLKLALSITSAKLGYAQRTIQEADGTSSPDRDINR